jgi:hypothetical protein
MSIPPEYEFTDPDGNVQRESSREHLVTAGATHCSLVKRGGRWRAISLERSEKDAKDKLWYAVRKGFFGLDFDDETAVVEVRLTS